MGQIEPKMEKVLNIALLYQKLFCLFTEYTEEIILNEGSLRGSPTITFALNKEIVFSSVYDSMAMVLQKI